MNSVRKSKDANRNVPLLIVVIYAVFGALWILLSDAALKVLIQDAGDFAVASMFKGWFFVAITTLLLYGLLRRFAPQHLKVNANVPMRLANPRRWLTFALLALCLIGISAGGMAYHWRQKTREESERLQAIAELKTRHIIDWLAARQRSAEYIQSNVYFAELFRHWLDDGDMAAAAHLRLWMSQFSHSMVFPSTLFLDSQGHGIGESAEAIRKLPTSLLSAIKAAGRDSRVQRVGPYRDSENHIYLDFVVSIPVGDEPVATVILHSNPAESLFHALQKWPGTNSSGEILLFRRDGDNVLYLNELRHHQDSALKLHLPIANAELLAAQFARGAKQAGALASGVDYRGVPSVGVGYAIPGTDWFLIAKMDATDFYDTAIKESTGIALISLLMLTIGGTLLILQHQNSRLVLAMERQNSDQTMQLQADILANITEGVNVVARDDGRLLFVNPAFAALFGYQPDELVGRNVAILNAPTTAHTPEANATIIMEQLREVGCWQGEILNRRKDGSIFWSSAIVTSHVMPVWGNVWLSVQHDITHRKVAEITLKQRNETLERLNRVAIGRELEIVTMKQRINALTSELGREPPFNSPALNPEEVELAEPWLAENPQLAQLAMINLLEDAQTARDQARSIATSLRTSEQRLLMAQQGAHVGIWEWDLRNDSVYWSPEYERLYGVAPGQPHSNEDWRSRVHPDDLKLIDIEWDRHIHQEAPFEVEFRIRREDTGEMRWMYCIGSAQRDENGKAVILSGINIDITDRKLAEFALAESEQRYRALTDNVPGAVYRCDVKAPWRMIMISDGVKFLTGREAREFLSGDSPLTWGELIVTEDMPSVEQAVNIAVADRETYRLIYRTHHADGGIRWILEHGRAIYDAEGNPEFLDGVITDMTSQKQAEEQLRARNAELERFNRITIGREMDMIAMKKRINALSQELGHEPPYKLAFLNHGET